MLEVSVIVCARNEEKTLPQILQGLCQLPLSCEILVVDDGSSDQTSAVANRFCATERSVRLLRHSKGLGKGAAIRTALQEVVGEYVAIQDADLEYEVSDLPIFLDEMKRQRWDVAFGSRFLKENPTRYPFCYLGNQWVSRWISYLTGTRITDAYTGRKLFKSKILKDMKLAGCGFEIEAEIATKVGKLAFTNGLLYGELPINYHPRTKREGKKIKYWDGFKAFLEPLRWLRLTSQIKRSLPPLSDNR